ncbi:MAG TPA: hypothetical protein VJU87_08395 [Gemmatimonadaceae bacterium]|nr:hypothetical protein [Gemmatimonadaceae bacterium]
MKSTAIALALLLADCAHPRHVAPAGAVAPQAATARLPSGIRADALITDYARAAITHPPDSLHLDPFYQKYTSAEGLPITGSARVPDTALLVARDIVIHMLAKRPDVRDEMIRRGFRVTIMAESEATTDLPEQRDWKKPAIDDPRLTDSERAHYDRIAAMSDREYWNRRARGMGGRMTSGAEENILGYPGTRYYGENILVHEFSHGIMSALRTADSSLYTEILAAYRNAKAKGMYRGHYAANTVAEYWAEGTQWWFWSNIPATFDGQRLSSPDDLERYDPALYGIFARVYPDHHIPMDVYWNRDAGRGAQQTGAQEHR